MAKIPLSKNGVGGDERLKASDKKTGQRNWQQQQKRD